MRVLRQHNADPRTLRRHPDNPRRGDTEAIKRSIRALGFFAPVVHLPDGTVLAGNHRLAAAIELGLESIPAIEVEVLDADEARRILLADNRTSDLATYDPQALADCLRGLPDPADLGFDAGFLRDLDKEVRALEREARGGGEVQAEAGTKREGRPDSEPGSVYALGPHRLICGDSLLPETREKIGKADAVWTDPPYAIYGSATGVSSDIADDKMVRPMFRGILEAIVSALPWFGPAYVACDWRSWASWWEVGKQVEGMTCRNMIVWDKGGGLGSNYQNSHELVGYWVKVKPSGAMRSGQERGIRPVNRSNVVRISRVSGDAREHNAQKPTDLIEHCLGAHPPRRSTCWTCSAAAARH